MAFLICSYPLRFARPPTLGGQPRPEDLPSDYNGFVLTSQISSQAREKILQALRNFQNASQNFPEARHITPQASRKKITSPQKSLPPKEKACSSRIKQKRKEPNECPTP